MERVFKIKTKSQPDISNQYPSERRYSSSMVLGLGLVLLTFGLCSLLMAILTVHKISLFGTENHHNSLGDKLAKDLEYSDRTYVHYYVNIPGLIATGCFLMTFGDILAFITAVLAWKRWYIDHNITFCFLASSFSTLTSGISSLISILTCCNVKFDTYKDYEEGIQDLFPITIPMAVNIIALSLINTLWSILATKVAFQGMRSSYPDDLVAQGQLKATTKGQQLPNNNNINNIPIEVINNFAIGKMAKYLPKKENMNLPKQESNAEYQQRVDKFLNTRPEDTKGNEVSEEKGVEADEVQCIAEEKK